MFTSFLEIPSSSRTDFSMYPYVTFQGTPGRRTVCWSRSMFIRIKMIPTRVVSTTVVTLRCTGAIWHWWALWGASLSAWPCSISRQQCCYGIQLKWLVIYTNSNNCFRDVFIPRHVCWANSISRTCFMCLWCRAQTDPDHVTNSAIPC